MTAINNGRMSPERRAHILEEGQLHLRNRVRIYWGEIADGNCFLHEAPNGATPWKRPEFEELARHPDVHRVNGPMCVWGMESQDEQGEGLVYKPIGWFTNSPDLARVLNRFCGGIKISENFGSDAKVILLV